MTRDIQSTAAATDSETLDEVIRRLFPTPAVPPPKAAPIPSDQELLIQRLLGVIRPSQPILQERSKLTDMEIVLQNFFGEYFGVSGGVFFLWGDGYETDQCQELDESFPLLPVGWQADRIGDDILLRPGPTGAPNQQAENVD